MNNRCIIVCPPLCSKATVVPYIVMKPPETFSPLGAGPLVLLPQPYRPKQPDNLLSAVRKVCLHRSRSFSTRLFFSFSRAPSRERIATHSPLRRQAVPDFLPPSPRAATSTQPRGRTPAPAPRSPRGGCTRPRSRRAAGARPRRGRRGATSPPGSTRTNRSTPRTTRAGAAAPPPLRHLSQQKKK